MFHQLDKFGLVKKMFLLKRIRVDCLKTTSTFIAHSEGDLDQLDYNRGYILFLRFTITMLHTMSCNFYTISIFICFKHCQCVGNKCVSRIHELFEIMKLSFSRKPQNYPTQHKISLFITSNTSSCVTWYPCSNCYWQS